MFLGFDATLSINWSRYQSTEYSESRVTFFCPSYGKGKLEGSILFSGSWGKMTLLQYDGNQERRYDFLSCFDIYTDLKEDYCRVVVVVVEKKIIQKAKFEKAFQYNCINNRK